MADQLTTLAIAGLGSVGTLVAQALFKVGEQWLSQRVTANSEQKKLAQEILMRVERFCSEVARRRWKEKPGVYDDPLDALREEIVAMSVGLRDGKARSHFEQIDSAMWFVLDPGLVQFANPEAESHPYPIKMSCRILLGAILRDEKVPTDLPGLKDLVEAAKEASDYIEDHSNALKAHAEEMAEERRQKFQASAIQGSAQ